MPAERSDIGRLEAFSDGVFAIASTSLILNVQAHGTPLSRALLHAWPSYAAYAVSFVIIGIIWMNHHAAFGQIARVDRTFLMVNVLFLMFVAFIPFPAGLLAEHLGGTGAKAAAVFYGATLTLTGISANLFWLYAVRRGVSLAPRRRHSRHQRYHAQPPHRSLDLPCGNAGGARLGGGGRPALRGDRGVLRLR
jgi:uncharacterized membrane protein